MYVGLLLLTLIILFVTRVAYVIKGGRGKKLLKSCSRTLIIIGSGGHTSEMTRQITNLNPRLYQPRLYVLAESDTASKVKIESVESKLKTTGGGEYQARTIPRSRAVGQSYVTSVFSVIYSTIASIPIVYTFKPDLILCNGPGTCVPVCAIAFLMNVLFLSRTRIVFIESVCRVRTLSLTGKILLRFADKILVQWPELQAKYPKTEYIGRLT